MVKTTKHSIQEWSQLFKSFVEDSGNTERKDTMHQISFITKIPLKTPLKATNISSVQDPFPYDTPAGIRKVENGPLAMDESTWESVLDLAGIPEDLI
jgi:hypothetical protein